MKNQSKGFIVGCILTLIATIGFNSFAITQAIEVFFNDIKIKINGNLINTNNDKPFIYNGRTYIPARYIAEGLGATVKWNETENTIEIDKHMSPPTPNIIPTFTPTPTVVPLINGLTQEELNYLKTVKEKINKHSDKYDFILNTTKQIKLDKSKINDSDVENSKNSVYEEYLFFKTNIPLLKFVNLNKNAYAYFDKLFMSYTYLDIFKISYNTQSLFSINSANEQLSKITSNIYDSAPILQDIWSELNNYLK